jgi:hypothetical protein
LAIAAHNNKGNANKINFFMNCVIYSISWQKYLRITVL